jgi:tetratricopeptide (TPR) repeat protein
MPQRRTDDVIHVTMTDHFIQRRPPPAEELLAPKQERGGTYRGDVVAYYPEKIDPDKRDLYMGLAYIANSANLEKGIGFLDAALARAGDRPFPAVYTRGVALKLLGRMQEAREGLEEAIRLRPDHPQAWMALGDLHEQMKNYKRSIECYTMASRLDPRLSRAQNGLGTSLMLSGDLDSAAKAFRSAMTLDPFDDNPHLNLSGIYLQKGDFTAAAAEARAALAVNPNRPAGWGHLAQCALGQKKAGEALWPVLQAIKLDGTEMQNGEVLASVAKALGPRGTLAALDKLTSYTSFAWHVSRSHALLELGDAAGASVALDGAAAMTSSPAVMVSAAQCGLEAGRPDLALLWASEIAEKRPQEEQPAVIYASALRANGDDAQAAAVLEKALQAERSPRLLNALAWLRATARNDAMRNGAQAEQLLNEAMASMGKPNVFLLQTQAAVAAENGNYPMAAATAQQALDMARNAMLNVEARKIEEQLASYNKGQPYRSQW